MLYSLWLVTADEIPELKAALCDFFWLRAADRQETTETLSNTLSIVWLNCKDHSLVPIGSLSNRHRARLLFSGVVHRMGSSRAPHDNGLMNLKKVSSRCGAKTRTTAETTGTDTTWIRHHGKAHSRDGQWCGISIKQVYWYKWSCILRRFKNEQAKTASRSALCYWCRNFRHRRFNHASGTSHGDFVPWRWHVQSLSARDFTVSTRIV